MSEKFQRLQNEEDDVENSSDLAIPIMESV
jgi:hypothetical protein